MAYSGGSSSSGDVVGPASAVDGHLAVFDGPTGKLLKDGGAVPGAGVKQYVALLTQSGTDAPVATVLANTLGGVPVWTREAQGFYKLTLAGAFTSSTTPIDAAILNTNSGVFNGLHGAFADVDSYNVRTYSSLDLTNPADDILTNYLFSISVYPA